MIFKRLFGKNPHGKSVESLCGKIMAHARNPVFYTKLGVPDTLDGRFDMLVLHVFLTIHRLKDEDGAEEIARQLPEKMLNEIDRALRENGISDMGVPRRVKGMAKAFLGRATAYENALNDTNDESLEAVLTRNLFPGEDIGAKDVSRLVRYIIAAEAHLKAKAYDDILAGEASFPEVEGF